MISRIIFCTAVCLTLLAVLLLSVLSPIPYKNQPNRNNDDRSSSLVALSLFIQQPTSINTPSTSRVGSGDPSSGVLTFERTLTVGPQSTSKIVGNAQGFIIPVEHFAHSAFNNIIYLTFNTSQYYGSLSIQAKQLDERKKRDELVVVGGTGSFAFARGVAVFELTTDQGVPASIYHVSLRLVFPNHSQSIRV
ncbi:hypothetical protein vseg_006797 [Gypsophila vaccaria]